MNAFSCLIPNPLRKVRGNPTAFDMKAPLKWAHAWMIFSDFHAEDVTLRSGSNKKRGMFFCTHSCFMHWRPQKLDIIYYMVVVYDSSISRDAEMLVFQPSFEFSAQNGVMYVHYD